MGSGGWRYCGVGRSSEADVDVRKQSSQSILPVLHAEQITLRLLLLLLWVAGPAVDLVVEAEVSQEVVVMSVKRRRRAVEAGHAGKAGGCSSAPWWWRRELHEAHDLAGAGC